MKQAKLNLVFLHGGPGYRDYLRPFFENQFDDYFQTHFYDQSQGDVDLSDLKLELEQKLKNLNHVVLIGHSWGGTLALEYLRDRKENISGLVLLDACVHHKHAGEDFLKNLEKNGIDMSRVEMILFSKEHTEEGQKLLTNLNSTFDSKMFEKFDKKYLAKIDLLDVLKKLQIPVLNIYGSQDLRIPSSSLKTLALLNSKIENCEIEGAGHFPFLFAHHHKKIVQAIEQFARKRMKNTLD